MLALSMLKNNDNIIGFCLALFLAAIVFGVNYGISGPVIQADEGSYLGNAAAMAGYSFPQGLRDPRILGVALREISFEISATE
jgi:hypothetical protein